MHEVTLTVRLHVFAKYVLGFFNPCITLYTGISKQILEHKLSFEADSRSTTSLQDKHTSSTM
jgi:hypothetical protein